MLCGQVIGVMGLSAGVCDWFVAVATKSLHSIVLEMGWKGLATCICGETLCKAFGPVFILQLRGEYILKFL